MKHHISAFLCRWVAFVESSARSVLLALAVITAMAGAYAYQNFSINSDLGDLIHPSKDNAWYAQAEGFKEAFPQYRNTALVVVSGASAAETSDAAELLVHSLRRSGDFEEVFAPAYDDFFQQRVLYSVPTEGVKRISESVLENIESLQGLIQQPDIPRFMSDMHKRLQDDQQLEYFSQDTLQQMAQAVKVVSLLQKAEVEPLTMVEKLQPRDTDDMHYQIIVIRSRLQFDDELPSASVIHNIRQVLQQQILPESVQVRLSGEVALANEEIAAGMSGVELAGGMSLVILALILGIGIRSLSVIIAMFIMLFMGIVLTAAYATAVIGSYNTLSLIFLVMFFGLGIDFAVHYCLRLIEARADHDESQLHSWQIAATQDIGSTLLLCAITSSLAFLAFLPTAYNGLAELGIISAGGMAFAFILSLTFFPAWFTVFGLGNVKSASLPMPTKATANPGRWSPAVLLLTVVAALFSGGYAKDVQFNYSVLAMRDKGTEAMSTLLELQQQGIVTDYSIAVVAGPDTDMKALSAELQALPSVAKVELPADLLPQFQVIKQQYMLPVEQRLNKLSVAQPVQLVDAKASEAAMQSMLSMLDVEHQDDFIDEDEVALRAFSGALQQLLQQPELWSGFQLAIATGVNADVARLKGWFSAQPYGFDDLPDNIRQRFYQPDVGYLLNVLPAGDMTDRQQTDRFVAEVMAVAPNVAGRTIMEWGIGKVVVESFQMAVGIAVVAITLLLAIYFRQVLPVILVLIPLGLTTLFTFAFIQLSGMTLNMANILVVPLIFGLGVDTGIHVVHRYHQSYSLREMLFSSTSKAVLISALTTIGTFISLSFSPHKGAASIGMLLSVAITLLLLTTFIVLPALLSVFDRRNGGGAAS